MIEHRLACDVAAPLAHSDQQWPFLPARMGNGDHCRLGDAGMVEGAAFDGDAGNPFAARLDDVLRAIDDVEAAVGVDACHVAGRQPATGQLLLLQIACRDDVAACLQVTESHAVPWQDLALVVDDAQLGAEGDAARPQLVLDLLRRRGIRQPGRQRRLGRPQRLGHAPALCDFDAVASLESLDEGTRRLRACHQGGAQRSEAQSFAIHVVEQGQPHRGHRSGQRHLLGSHQLVEPVGFEVAPRQHELVAVHRRRIDHLPAVAVKQRRDRHHHLARARAIAADHVGGAHDQGAEQGRAMRVDDAFRHAGRARGVADGRGPEFVELRPVVFRVLGGEQGLIVEHGPGRIGRDRGAVAEIDPAFDRRQLGGDTLGDRQGRVVKADPAVLGMIDDEGDLLLEQAGIDRMQHRTGTRHAVEQLEVMVRVPGQGSQAIAALHAQRRQRLGQPLDPRPGIAVGVAMQAAVDGARHDLRRAMRGGGMFDDARYQQRRFHDQAAHGGHFRATSRLITSPRDTNFSPSNWQSCMAWKAR